jgi:pimeloyl-ACP methyl ester carboxylesterase
MPKINRDGVKIYYEVHGSGPPLLLTHGYSSTSAMWQGQIEALSVGAEDAPFLAASDYMAAKIPEAKKVVIPAAGHAVNIDQPQAFIDAVLPFLDGLPRNVTPERLAQS